MEPTGVTDKANDAQVTLQGDASLEFGQDFMGLERCWPIEQDAFFYTRRA